jgi:hypothetical protein
MEDPGTRQLLADSSHLVTNAAMAQFSLELPFVPSERTEAGAQSKVIGWLL